MTRTEDRPIEAHELGGLSSRLCRVWSPKRCDTPAVLHGNGFELPLCEHHARMLSRPMFDKLVEYSTVTLWDMAKATAAHAHLRACLILIRRQAYSQ